MCRLVPWQARNASYAEAFAPFLDTLPTVGEVLSPELFTPAMLDALQSDELVWPGCYVTAAMMCTNQIKFLQILVQEGPCQLEYYRSCCRCE